MLVANLQDHLEGPRTGAPERPGCEGTTATEGDEYERAGVDRRRRRLRGATLRRRYRYEDTRYGLLVLSLCGRVGDLEHLVQHQTLMGALARVLQEDGKKSTRSRTTSCACFSVFSNFVEMHQLLAQHRVGSVCLEVVAFETDRITHHSKEIEKRSWSGLDTTR